MQRFLLELTLGLAALGTISSVFAGEPTPKDVFEQRIMPIFKSPQPSSCVQCHLAGVDLKNYILPSHELTFRSLRDQGLIDLDNPARSRILHLIEIGEKDSPGAALIHAKVRKAEYDAFASWIKACCADPTLREAPPLAREEQAAPPRPVEVIRHARKDRLLESFEGNIWAMRFRCMSCHIEGSPQCDKLVKEHGARMAWMKKEGAEATMRYLISRPNLVRIKEPEKSLLLRKPLNEVEHEGGKKFLPGDQGYKGFRSWIADYARLRSDGYKTAADLPEAETGPKRFGSDIWLKLTDTPPAWGDRLLQVDVYAWDNARNTWESTPVATSDRGVWGKGKLWQHTLTLLAPAGSERAKQWHDGKVSLPPGRYLVKVYVDQDAKLARDWKAKLTEADFVGQGEVRSHWPTTYQSMTTIKASDIHAPR